MPTASDYLFPRRKVHEFVPTGNTVWKISTCQILSPGKIDGSSDGFFFIFFFSFRLGGLSKSAQVSLALRVANVLQCPRMPRQDGSTGR